MTRQEGRSNQSAQDIKQASRLILQGYSVLNETLQIMFLVLFFSQWLHLYRMDMCAMLMNTGKLHINHEVEFSLLSFPADSIQQHGCEFIHTRSLL